MVVIPRAEDFTTEAADGRVLLNGAGVALTLDPETALHVADQLSDAAAVAMGQRTTTEIGQTPKPI